MCIVVFGFQVHPEYQLILAANRDEFYDRPTDRAAWWSSSEEDDAGHKIKILSGRDGLSGGTWIGVSLEGRFAAVTNYRDGSGPELANARSRGLLVTSWLTGKSKASPELFLKDIAADDQAYNGFNLIIGDTRCIWYYSNRSESNIPVQLVQPGIYALSNALLDTPWPKVVRAKSKLKEVLHSGNVISHDKLLELMSDPWRPPDDDLPDTSMGIHYERVLSATFLSPKHDPNTKLFYGTCCSTVITIDSKDTVQFTERSFQGDAAGTPDAKFAFRVGSENH